MISISLCMIVKNEEKVLARCLDSIKDLMDEIIIVDTGSTDRTKEIAYRYTDKVYDFVWTQDFSEARNFSFSKATKDYIYVADADEVLDEENRKVFFQLKQVLLPEIDIVQMYYSNQMQHNTTYNFDKEYRPKLYKRLREFHWQDPIHESVCLDPIVYDSEISILHMPENNHSSRDFSVFQNMIKKGKRVSKKLHNMYARELYITGEKKDFTEAKEFFQASIMDESRGIDEIKEAALVLAKCFRLDGNIQQFFKYIMKDIVTEPSSEACCELGTFYLELEDYEEASNWFLNAMEGTEPILNIRSKEELPKVGLKKCYESLAEKAKENGNKELSEKYNEAIIQLEVEKE